MADDFTALQVLQQMFANVEQVDSEEEAEDVSEEEDAEECHAENVSEEEEDAEERHAENVSEEEGDEERNAENVSEEEEEGGEDGEERNAERRDLSAPEEDKADSDPHEDQVPDTFVSKNGKIKWSSVPCVTAPPPQRKNTERPPGPTAYAVSHARDMVSTFLLFVTPQIERVILDETNREGYLKRGEEWKFMDATDLRAYLGLLILAGVYKSRGEAAASLWDAQSGRVIFRATMPLKLFYTYSSTLRFDDRGTRAARRATDKLAAIREVWDMWVERLPRLYDPGPEVTVDEQLVAFRGRCPFRQYMPSKPAKYGIKSWVACDAKSSYAWKMQVYTGKLSDGAPERNLGMRVVLDMTEGLKDRNVTCDNLFTSYELGRELMTTRNMTMVGTVRKNRSELPTELLATNRRRVLSSQFAFTPTTTLVSYLAKKKKNVLLMSTRHTDAEISDRDDGKPTIILDYNRNKGGVDNLDKVVTYYSCKRKTARWPLVIFDNMIDVSTYNAFVIWREINPNWMPGKRNKRRFFLEQLGRALVNPLIERRQRVPHTAAAAAVVRGLRTASCRGPPPQRQPEEADDDDDEAPAAASSAGPSSSPPVTSCVSKRKRCQVCPVKKDNKTTTVCRRCKKYVCRACSHVYCPTCPP
ncbi:piggyBac transposable element-derived protein 4-like [Osmerus mordax]|uniref:piggyBac transposable element-derived protein 4-like n=1 Tax=Osmerus mordax TaxID=8014 RepID=UPI00350F933E